MSEDKEGRDMLREFNDDVLFCYHSDRKKFKDTIIAGVLTCLAMLALVVMLTVNPG
jgi:hypothetical protein